MLATSEKACLVGPGSVNDHPPTEIQVCRPLYISFRAVKQWYRVAEFESMGAIWKVSGSKKAKAKLTWVKPARLRSSDCTWVRLDGQLT